MQRMQANIQVVRGIIHKIGIIRLYNRTAAGRQFDLLAESNLKKGTNVLKLADRFRFKGFFFCEAANVTSPYSSWICVLWGSLWGRIASFSSSFFILDDDGAEAHMLAEAGVRTMCSHSRPCWDLDSNS